MIDFHESWGFDSLNNFYAPIIFSSRQWIKFEMKFFQMFRQACNIIFAHKEIIVTPYLERNWLLYNNKIEDKQYDWIQNDYKEYIVLLEEARIENPIPQWNNQYRGGIITNFIEFEIQGKIAVKGLPLLFFNNGDRFVTITDYLTIMIKFKDKYILERAKAKLLKIGLVLYKDKPVISSDEQ
ncbi:hypothetical protein [Serpentinicella alkaliphila]|uniref:Uncharacterized protein n=1 Tax=Serpentinicella alkaliphila TaxID=1734049 RepID=A0A4R2TV74_9FIRM|nr:hypothetical protein [Serpentinicella alkaliphila]QUH26567.1 hypothetical protein HZR23_13120 [Serpentinicella alkaliphila]TCP99052.1 hypothetical protein EDD79_103715 [Serpentinicella alkaliphila]